MSRFVVEDLDQKPIDRGHVVCFTWHVYRVGLVDCDAMKTVKGKTFDRRRLRTQLCS